MRGFSLIEILVVIGIMAIILLASLSGFSSLRTSGQSRHDALIYIDALREAESRARNMEYDTDWGVKITGGNTIVFSGTTYAGRVLGRDHIYDSSDTLTISGPTEISFAKFTVTPSTSGTTTFQNSYGSSTVNVSANGLISY
jgi:prepilin-type N-terminal cleavage/methylation domain-containing protein